MKFPYLVFFVFLFINQAYSPVFSQIASNSNHFDILNKKVLLQYFNDVATSANMTYFIDVTASTTIVNETNENTQTTELKNFMYIDYNVERMLGGNVFYLITRILYGEIRVNGKLNPPENSIEFIAKDKYEKLKKYYKEYFEKKNEK